MKKRVIVSLLIFFISFTANVCSFSYQYDSKVRTEEWRLTDTLSAKRVHDSLGNHIEWSDWSGSIYFTYDQQSKLKEVINADGRKTQYAHTSDGTCSQIIYPSDLRIQYDHDCDKNIREVLFGGEKVTYLYDYSCNLVKERRLGNGIVTNFEHDESRRITVITHTSSSGDVIASFHFNYDIMGNRTLFRKKTSQVDETTRYIYDHLYRLKEVHYYDGSKDMYSYDALGNRLSKETTKEVIHYEYDNFGRLIRANDTNYFYNSNGWLVKKTSPQKTCEYGYNALGQLIKYQDSNYQVSFAYNARGERLSKTVNGKVTNYSYDAIFRMPYVFQEDQEGKARNYIYANSLIGCVEQDELYYFLEDSPSNPVGLIANRKGDIVEECHYDAFGQTHPCSYTSLQYNGEQLDSETGLIFLRLRYYDPEIGRFITPDQVPGKASDPQSWNLYVYAYNNPIAFCDPWGTSGEGKLDDPVLWGWSKGEPIWKQGDPLPPKGWEIAVLSAREPGIFANNSMSSDETFRGLTSMAGHAFSALITQDGDFKSTSGHKVPLDNGICNTDWKDLAYDLNTLWVGWLVPEGKGKAAHCQGEIFAAQGYNLLCHNCVHTTTHIARASGLSKHISVPIPSYMETEPAFIMSDARLAPSSLYTRLEHIIEQQGAGDLLHSIRPATQGDKVWPFLPTLPPAIREKMANAPRSGRGIFGGISLSKRAELKLNLQDIQGAVFDELSGQIFLIGKKGLKLPDMRLDDLAVAIQSIYGLKGKAPADPGITIDEPKAKKGRMRETMDVHYLGETAGTQFGRILFDGDVTLKELAFGIRGCHVNGFRSVFDRFIDKKQPDFGFNRLWLVPETISLKESPDGSSMIFDKVKMCCLTERFKDNLNSSGSWQAFAQHFTDNYDAISQEYPIFAEVKRLGQITGIVKWIKDNNIPFDLGFFSAYSPEPCDTPFRTRIQYYGKRVGPINYYIYGGIEMHLDATNFSISKDLDTISFKDAILASRPSDNTFSWTHQTKEIEAFPLVKTRKTGNFQKTFIDIDFPAPGDFPLRLMRFYDSFNDRDNGLGRGWSIVPYELQLSEKVQASADGRDCFVYPMIISQEGSEQWIYRPHRAFSDKVIYIREDNKQGLVQASDGLWTLALQEGGTVSFNSQGILTHVNDRHGIPTQFVYEGGRLVAIENNHHSIIHLTWANNRLIKATSPLGEVVSYSYNNQSSLNQVSAQHHSLNYDYDQDLRLTYVDFDQMTIFEGGYDDYNRLSFIKIGESELSCVYNLGAHTTCITTPEGTQIASLFDKDYSLIDQRIDGKEVSAEGWISEYDKSGLLIKAEDPSGSVWRFTYNNYGDLFLSENPQGDCTYYSYDQARRLKSKCEHIINAQFNSDRTNLLSARCDFQYRTEYFYNDLGRLASQVIGNRKTQFSYDKNGILCGITQPSGYTIKRTLDEKLRTKSVLDSGGLLREYTYDELNRIISIRTPAGITHYTYDSHGNIKDIIDGLGNTTTFDFDNFLIKDAEGSQHFFKPYLR